MRSRIPLAALLLQTVMDITKEHKSVYLVAFLTMLVQAILSVYVSCASDAITQLTNTFTSWLIFAVVASLETWSECVCSKLFTSLIM